MSLVESVGLKTCGFEAWFWSRRCGYVVGLASREVGGGSRLCLPPGRGAGLTPLNTPAHHCGGTPVRRRRADAPRRRREPPSPRLLAEVPRDAGPPLEPWIPASRLRGRGGQPESEIHQVCKDRCVPFGNWPKPPAETP
ncbi:MAG: hypothetical protein ACO2PN_20300 [Pyrobaculum sp.]